jgi:hypothetical protein
MHTTFISTVKTEVGYSSETCVPTRPHGIITQKHNMNLYMYDLEYRTRLLLLLKDVTFNVLSDGLLGCERTKCKIPIQWSPPFILICDTGPHFVLQMTVCK